MKPISTRWLALQIGTCLFVGGMLIYSATRQAKGPKREDVNLADAALQDLEKRGYQPLSGPLDAILKDTTQKAVPTQTHPLLGQSAPDFKLVDTDGESFHLSERLKSSAVVLVFYYGYACDHCVSQLFGLNKDLDQFRELGATVVAVSADPAELTRKRFKQYGAFAFPVLSDSDHAVAKLFGTYIPPAKPDEDGELSHGTFVIDQRGIVVWANRGDQPFTHNRTLLLKLHLASR